MHRVLWLGVAVVLVVGCASAKVPIATGKAEEKSVGSDCCISFRDLFKLAKGREWTADEAQHFRLIDQPERNRLVKVLAAEAGCVRIEDRIGTDGKVYTAFWLDEAEAKKCSQAPESSKQH